jgi:hypothetical protein
MSRHRRLKQQMRLHYTEQEKAMFTGQHSQEKSDGDEALGPHVDLTIRFYPKVQQVELLFKPEELRRWEFIVAILGMGTEWAQNHLKVFRMQQMAMQQQASMQEAALREALQSKGKIIH